MRKLFFGFIAVSAMIFTSCSEDDGDDGDNGGNGGTSVVIKSGSITADETWTSDKVYRLDGRVLVTNDAELTIQPGTIIKASPGTGAFASALIVTRDGTINAAGTASKPIIFTSIADDIQPGQTTSPNLEPTNSGLWGGVIILGDAPISAQNSSGTQLTELQIEGIPTSVDAKYGGNNGSDNSGTFTYVSIRHGGSNIGAGNEINGLTLGGVGSGTTINNIEIVANQDDGVEWFGGDVSVSDVLVWNSGDDGLDTDQDWIGTCSNFLVVTPRGGSAFELDGPEGNLNRGFHTFTDGVVYAGPDIDHLVDWDGSTNAAVSNVYFYGIDADYQQILDDPSTPDDDESFDPVESFGGDGSGTSTGWEYTLPAGAAAVAEIFTGVDPTILTAVSENQNSVGYTSDFSWTWASQSGALAQIGQ